MFACFVDFKKAFDSVSYWKLFLKLLNDGVNALIVRLLAAWYCKTIRGTGHWSEGSLVRKLYSRRVTVTVTVRVG